MSARRLEDKVVVVTGSTGLIGKQQADAVAQAGANVVCVDLDEAAVNAQAEALAAEHDVQAIGVVTNIADKASVEGLRDAVLRTFDRIDGLVNNAAINDKFEDPAAAFEQSKFERYPLELWQASMDVNVTGTFLMCQVLGEAMAKAGTGAIVNVASTYGIVAPDQGLYVDPDGKQTFFKTVAYPVSKAAVIQLTRFVATYWGQAGVRANTLSPGGVQAGQDDWFVEAYAKKTPLGRMAQPDDYRGAVVFLLSDESRYMTGSNLVVDGGWTVW